MVQGGWNLARWEKYTEIPLAVGALLFLIGYAIQILFDISDGQILALDVLLIGLWMLFGIDYFVSWYLAENRSSWFWRHVHLLLMLILPVLRPLRLLRLIPLLSVLQGQARSRFRERVSVYLLGSTILLVLIGALAVLDAEQNDPESNIRNFPNALWWAIVTVTTVGYGDFYPVTPMGRLIAIALMVAGISALGVITGALASCFMERISQETAQGKSAGQADGGADADPDAELMAEMRALREENARLRHARHDFDTP
ncbi:potassium channel family protein [Acaricomes phytoseiuli]|uniref:potassium channel family protein n=1 Tax=Acaricomes phytoseiuli TaxID=291968 RepID=UPI000375ACB6|nr:potassium channel family protein [Acaricomes phytoseiuli]